MRYLPRLLMALPGCIMALARRNGIASSLEVQRLDLFYIHFA